MADNGATKNIPNIINTLRQKIAKMSGEENSETIEVISEKYKINWNDFVDDYGEDGWGFNLEAFDKEVQKINSNAACSN